MIHFAPTTVSQTTTNSTISTMTAVQQGDREQEPVLFEIGQRDQGDHQGGDDVAEGNYDLPDGWDTRRSHIRSGQRHRRCHRYPRSDRRSPAIQDRKARKVIRDFAAIHGSQGEQGPAGPSGGLDGYSPVFAIATDGDRRVLEVVDWVGGTGTKPLGFPDDPVTPGATSYSNSGGTGDRTSLILVKTNKSFDSGSPDNLVDGNTGNNGTNSVSFPSADTGWEIWFDFRPTGFKQCIDEFRWKQNNTSTHGTWKIQAWDGFGWTDLLTGITLGGATTQALSFSNSDAYIIYRMVQTGGVTSSSPSIQEVEFKIAQGDAVASAATGYSNPGGSGDRQSTITVSTDITLSSGTVPKLVDGVTNSGGCDFNGGSKRQAHSRSTLAPAPSRLSTNSNGMPAMAPITAPGCSRGRIDDSGYDDVGTPFTLNGPAGGGSVTYSNPAYNRQGYRYYRLLQISGTTSGSPSNWEIEFKIANASAPARYFVGESGLVTDIADAVDIRGPVGADGSAGSQGPQGDKGDKGDPGAGNGAPFELKETATPSGGTITTAELTQDSAIIALNISAASDYFIQFSYSLDGSTFSTPATFIIGPAGLFGSPIAGGTVCNVNAFLTGLLAGYFVARPAHFSSQASGFSGQPGAQVKYLRFTTVNGSQTPITMSGDMNGRSLADSYALGGGHRARALLAPPTRSRRWGSYNTHGHRTGFGEGRRPRGNEQRVRSGPSWAGTQSGGPGSR